MESATLEWSALIPCVSSRNVIYRIKTFFLDIVISTCLIYTSPLTLFPFKIFVFKMACKEIAQHALGQKRRNNKPLINPSVKNHSTQIERVS